MIPTIMDLLKLPQGFGDYWVLGTSLRNGEVSVASASTSKGANCRYALRVGEFSPGTDAAVRAFIARHSPYWASSHIGRVSAQLAGALSTAVARREPTALALVTIGRSSSAHLGGLVLSPPAILINKEHHAS